MRRLDRTLLRDIAVPFAAGLAFLFVVLFSLYFLQGTGVLVGAAVRPLDLFRIFVYLSPHFLALGMPVALLLAVLVAVGRMAEDRELVALASAGVSPWRLLPVPLLLGALVAAVGVGLAVYVEPQGRRGVRLHLNELIKRNVAGEVRGGVFYEDLGEVVLYAERVERISHAWRNVLVHDDRDPEAALLLLARRGGVDPVGGSKALGVVLEDGEIHRARPGGGEYAVIGFDRAEVGLSVEWTLLSRNRFGGTPFEEQSVADIRRARTEEEARGGPGWPYALAVHRRFARPLAAVAFAVLAVPVGLARRRASRAVGFAATALVAAGYYVLSRAGTALVEGGLSVPVGAHLGNLVVGAIAAALLWRAARAGAR